MRKIPKYISICLAVLKKESGTDYRKEVRKELLEEYEAGMESVAKKIRKAIDMRTAIKKRKES